MIEIKNLSKYYNNNKVLNNINLEIRKGEIFGIIGHSGAGKSTILRCINGLTDYQEGSVSVDSKEIKSLSKNEIRELRKNLGMIFQHFSLLERRTVFENVALPMECFGYSKADIKKRVEELLDLVGIADKRDVKPKNLSGGQKQRVAIARALTLSPEFLLCDEATSALDPNTTKSILALLDEINKKLGITIVVVTHQMEVIKQICNRIAIMEDGKVLEVGDTEDVFLQNKSALRKLIGEENIVLPEGMNIKIRFPKEISNEPLITTMARKLDANISITYGKLEQFREDILGSLIITIDPEDGENVKKFLSDNNVIWEEL
ncbi:MAG: methionine ABC transporter ATP-binding protein [Clostridioides sp.]|jgi:D-methionine transport system ATP-binding protein|nr:methionine ABC transporter ATP-binding protein [Clostridioides sp.]